MKSNFPLAGSRPTVRSAVKPNPTDHQLELAKDAYGQLIYKFNRTSDQLGLPFSLAKVNWADSDRYSAGSAIGYSAVSANGRHINDTSFLLSLRNPKTDANIDLTAITVVLNTTEIEKPRTNNLLSGYLSALYDMPHQAKSLSTALKDTDLVKIQNEFLSRAGLDDPKALLPADQRCNVITQFILAPVIHGIESQLRGMKVNTYGGHRLATSVTRDSNYTKVIQSQHGHYGPKETIGFPRQHTKDQIIEENPYEIMNIIAQESNKRSLIAQGENAIELEPIRSDEYRELNTLLTNLTSQSKYSASPYPKVSGIRLSRPTFKSMCLAPSRLELNNVTEAKAVRSGKWIGGIVKPPSEQMIDLKIDQGTNSVLTRIGLLSFPITIDDSPLETELSDEVDLDTQRGLSDQAVMNFAFKLSAICKRLLISMDALPERNIFSDETISDSLQYPKPLTQREIVFESLTEASKQEFIAALSDYSEQISDALAEDNIDIPVTCPISFRVLLDAVSPVAEDAHQQEALSKQLYDRESLKTWSSHQTITLDPKTKLEYCGHTPQAIHGGIIAHAFFSKVLPKLLGNLDTHLLQHKTLKDLSSIKQFEMGGNIVWRASEKQG